MSGSLLLIAAVWLLLLAPLLLRNQSHVRRTSQALSETRVVHEGGTELRPALKMRNRLRPAAGHYVDSDEELELVDAEPDFVLIDDVAGTAHTGSAAPEAGPFTSNDATVNPKSADTEVPEVVDGEVVSSDDPADAEPGAADADTAAKGDDAATEDASRPDFGWNAEDTGPVPRVVEPQPLVIDVELAEETKDTAAGASATDAAKDSAENTADGSEAADSSAPGTTVAPAAAAASAATRPLRDIPAAYFRGGDFDPSADTGSGELSDPEAAPIAEALEPAELSADEMAYLASRRGRGVYDPVASQALVQARLRRRKQVLSVLVALSVITLACGVAFGAWAWFAFVLTIGFTAFYLYNLRRQAVEEAQLRARRIARMRRARLGVRNTEDEELGVPDRLLRPGAIIVEADDPDPEFLNLGYVNGSDFFDDHPDAPLDRPGDVRDSSTDYEHAV